MQLLRGVIVKAAGVFLLPAFLGGLVYLGFVGRLKMLALLPAGLVALEVATSAWESLEPDPERVGEFLQKLLLRFLCEGVGAAAAFLLVGHLGERPWAIAGAALGWWFGRAFAVRALDQEPHLTWRVSRKRHP